MAVKEQIAALLTWGVDGSSFGPRSATILTTTQVFIIPQGFWMVEQPAVASVSISFTPDAGTTTVVFVAAATSAKTLLFSDGFSWFLTNVTGTNTVNLTQFKGLF